MTENKTPVSEEAYNLLCCLRPVIENGKVVKTEGLDEFEKRLNKLLANDNKRIDNSPEPSEVCVIQNELMGLTITLGSKLYPVHDLQNQALKTMTKIIQKIPTKRPLGVD